MPKQEIKSFVAVDDGAPLDGTWAETQEAVLHILSLEVERYGDQVAFTQILPATLTVETTTDDN